MGEEGEGKEEQKREEIEKKEVESQREGGGKERSREWRLAINNKLKNFENFEKSLSKEKNGAGNPAGKVDCAKRERAEERIDWRAESRGEEEGRKEMTKMKRRRRRRVKGKRNK